MCINLKTYHINPINKFFAPHLVTVPCGKCVECQEIAKNQWSFRLIAEITTLVKRGWKLGFVTLTYKEKRLPHYFMKRLDNGKIEEVPCFCKDDCKTLLAKVRKKLYKDHQRLFKSVPASERPKFIPCKYILCCEYGSSTHRPHMHGLFIIPPEIPPLRVWQLLKNRWRKNGYIIPKDFDGGYDTKGHWHNPFVVEAEKSAAQYAAKYCCKDMYYEELLKQYDIVSIKKLDEGKTLRKIKPFHLQSRSLGKVWLDGLTESQKLDYLRNGFAFDGDSKMRPVPLYLRNKIFFAPKYRKVGTKRQVLREVTPFFRSHVKDILDIKSATYEQLFTDMQKSSWWFARGCEDCSSILQYIYDVTRFTSKQLAIWYIVYCGLKPLSAYTDIPEIQYLSRYTGIKYSFAKSTEQESPIYEKGDSYMSIGPYIRTAFEQMKSSDFVRKLNQFKISYTKHLLQGE